MGTWPVTTAICQSKIPGRLGGRVWEGPEWNGRLGPGRENVLQECQALDSCIQPFFDLAKCFVSISCATGRVPATKDTAVIKRDGAHGVSWCLMELIPCGEAWGMNT